MDTNTVGASLTEASTAAPLTGVGADTIREKLLNIPTPLVSLVEMIFTFRGVKNQLGDIVKRPPLKFQTPVPTLSGIVEGLADEKQQNYLISLLTDAIRLAVRDQIDDETKPVSSQDELDLSKLTLEYLANQPLSERRGSGIAKELWEAWAKDYMEVMPGLTGRDAEKTGNALQLFTKKLMPVKTSKPVLARLKDFLNKYTTDAPNAGDYTDILEFLSQRMDAYLKADEKDILASL